MMPRHCASPSGGSSADRLAMQESISRISRRVRLASLPVKSAPRQAGSRPVLSALWQRVQTLKPQGGGPAG
eukprot:scaffold3886_cov82-Isochrysis_galbana.AAC.3